MYPTPSPPGQKSKICIQNKSHISNRFSHTCVINPLSKHGIKFKSKRERKEGNVLFTVIWHQTYGKGLLIKQERKPATTTSWAIRF